MFWAVLGTILNVTIFWMLKRIKIHQKTTDFFCSQWLESVSCSGQKSFSCAYKPLFLFSHFLSLLEWKRCKWLFINIEKQRRKNYDKWFGIVASIERVCVCVPISIFSYRLVKEIERRKKCKYVKTNGNSIWRMSSQLEKRLSVVFMQRTKIVFCQKK